MPRLSRFSERLRFILERWLVRGAASQLLVVAGVIGLLSLLGAALVNTSVGRFENFGDAVWWAFLRLTDPGYLGDDVGVGRRVVSTGLTVLGYVVFLGALVAIMTQWLRETMDHLESGYTAISQRNHVLILGMTGTTATIVQELLLSEGRVRRFLERYRARRLQIVILAPRVNAGVVQALRERLGRLWDERQIVLRSGTPLQIEHLDRVAFAEAAAIIVPAGDSADLGYHGVDTQTIKTLLSISRHPSLGEGRRPPYAVAEVLDARKVEVARSAYGGEIEVLASDAVISRLIAQNLRHPGLAAVFNEILSQGDGAEIYVPDHEAFAGRRLQDLAPVFPGAILLGVVRDTGDGGLRPILNPPDGFELQPGDRLVTLADTLADAAPDAQAEPQTLARGPRLRPEVEQKQHTRVLILGWNHKLPALLAELDSYAEETFEVVVASTFPTRRRESLQRRSGLALQRTSLRHVELDYTSSIQLAELEPRGFDTVVMLASDQLRTDAESDARTIVGYLMLNAEIGDPSRRPHVLVELMDAGNLALLRSARDEFLVSPMLLSHMLSQVSLRRELRVVFDELFTAGGAEISFRSAADYGLSGREVDFPEVQRAASARGETAFGVHVGGVARLNPSREQRWRFIDRDQVIAMVTYD